MLSQDKLDAIRTKLEEEKRNLLRQIEEHEKPTDFGSDTEDMSEEEDEAQDFANRRAMSQALKDRVNEIDAALNKMELGTFGLCEKCNQEISAEMLAVVPETKLCANCKKLA
jgi:DnaK suppressor protein